MAEDLTDNKKEAEPVISNEPEMQQPEIVAQKEDSEGGSRDIEEKDPKIIQAPDKDQTNSSDFSVKKQKKVFSIGVIGDYCKNSGVFEKTVKKHGETF